MALLPDTLAAGAVELRRWRSEDVGPLRAAVRSSLPELSPWMPWVTQTRQEYVTALRTFEAAFDAGTDFGFGLHEPEFGVVGGCGLHRRGGAGDIEIGYWVRSDRHRRGHATSTAEAVTTAAFQYLDEVDAVYITMDEANTASAGVPARLGYRLLGTEDREEQAPGHTGRFLRWTVTRADWALIMAGGRHPDPTLA